MLSHDDQRRLEAIEQQLERDDPALARLLTHWPPPTSVRRTAIRGLLAVLGTLGILVSVLALSPALIVVALLAMTTSYAWKTTAFVWRLFQGRA